MKMSLETKFSLFQNGPVDNSKRYCTDCFCFMIFTLYVVGMIAIAAYGYQNGHFSKIT